MKTIILLITLAIPLGSVAQQQPPQEEKEIEVHGLDQFKQRKNSAVFVEVLGASMIAGYFVWDGIQDKRSDDLIIEMERVGDDYANRIRMAGDNTARASQIANEGARKLQSMAMDAPKPAKKGLLYAGAGFLTVGVAVHISAIEKLAQSKK